MKLIKISPTLVILGACVAFTGCSTMDRMGSKMDMAMGHKQSSGRVAYEGELETSRRVGNMIALQFKDGQYFDVSQESGALYSGDIVRVYETEKGYEAHLWRSTENASRQVPTTGG